MAVCCVTAAVVTAAGGGGGRYFNARFGYGVDEPGSDLVGRPEADNGDGRAWVSADGKAEMLVWARHNVLEQSLGDLMTEGRR